MELWRELLISGLQDKSNNFDFVNDVILKEIIENKCYKMLLQIKEIINCEELLDKDCFLIIEKIISALEESSIYCNRHDFG